MKENRVHHTYATDLHERFDLTRAEAAEIIKDELAVAQANNRALILTSRWSEDNTSFEAIPAAKPTHNYTWIHVCAQELLDFDDVEHPEGKFYISTFTGIAI